MKYEEFRQIVEFWPLISLNALKELGENQESLFRQLRRWKQQGKLVQLRQGVFMLREEDRKVHPSRMFVASELYRPSYVSLEFALDFYGLIPEMALAVTSVSSLKTAKFENDLGVFSYSTVKQQAFEGYYLLNDEAGLPCMMATQEKALVDFLYLRKHLFSGSHVGYEMLDSFRLQNTDSLDAQKLFDYGEYFGSEILMRKIEQLTEVL